jgi:hypothetical protein
LAGGDGIEVTSRFKVGRRPFQAKRDLCPLAVSHCCRELPGAGQAGVERVLYILRAELVLAMKLAGRPSVADLDRTLLIGP